ncbi:MAG: Gfo/Idh/MocA family oxidoreductase [Armatimonadetes bacterium]|nr:Gfo/Idh/MocA family oxidoreductase [Armatimonadota bacterium]
MKIGVIGAGQWGQNIVRTLHELDALGGVADASMERRIAIQSLFDAPVHEDYRAMLNDGIDGVVIATPPESHAAIAIDAISAGKHVLVEKPMALSSKEAGAIVEAAQAANRVLAVGHLLLYQPAVQKIAQYVREGRIGKLWALHQERLNLGRIRDVENVLWSIGVHDVAVALHLIGSKVTETTFVGDKIVQPEIEDDCYLHMAFENGAQSHLHCSWLWPERRRRSTLIGDKGIIVYDELEQTVTLHKKFFERSLTQNDQGAEMLFKGSGEPLKLEIQDFIGSIREGRSPIADGNNGLAVIQALEAAGD